MEKIGLEAVLEMAGFNRGLSAYMAAVRDMENRTGSAAGRFLGLGDSVLGAGAKLAAVAAGSVAALTGGLAALSAACTKTAADFESQMAILSTAVDDASISMDTLSEAALTVGSDTSLVGITASQAADAMTGLYKAGLTTADIFGDLEGYLAGTTELSGALRAAVDLQAASELDLAQASDVVAVAMSTFGLSAEDATRISNNFVQTADASVASVSELADAMANVGPTMASFGYSLEDTNIALALLSSRGIKGAEAGTALKSMMTNLMRPTKNVTKTLADLNVSLYDHSGVLKPLPTIIGELGAALDGLTEKQRNEAVQTLAGTYGMKAMNTLLAEGQPGWEALAAAVSNASSASEIASARTQTFHGAMEALRGVIETVQIRIGNALLPMLTDLARSFAEFIDSHSPQIEAAFQAIARWVGENLPIAIEKAAGFWSSTLLPALQEVWAFIQEDLIPIVETIAGWIGDQLPKAIEFVNQHWEEFRIALVAIAAILAGAAIASALASIAGAIAAIANPIGLVIAAVAALSAAWISDWGGIRTALTAWWEETGKPIFDAIVSWLQTYIPVAIQTLSDFWTNTLKPAIEVVWTFIQQNLIPILKDIWQWLGDTIPVVIAALADYWENTLLPALRIVWDFIETSLVPLFTSVAELLGAVVGKALEALAGLWQNVLLPALSAVWEFLEKNVLPILKVLANIIREEAEPMLEKMRRAFDSIKDALKPVIDFIKDLADKVKSLDLPDWLTPGSPTPFEKALNAIAIVIDDALIKALNAFTQVLVTSAGVWQLHFQALRAILDDLAQLRFPALQSAANTAFQSISSHISALTSAELPALAAAFQSMQEDAVEDLNAVSTAAESMAGALNAVSTDTLPGLKDAFSAAFLGEGGIVDAVESAATAISGMTAGLGTAEISVDDLKTAFSAFGAVAVGAVNAVRDAIGDAGSGLIAKINSIAGAVNDARSAWESAFVTASDSIIKAIQTVIDKIGSDTMSGTLIHRLTLVETALSTLRYYWYNAWVTGQNSIGAAVSYVNNLLADTLSLLSQIQPAAVGAGEYLRTIIGGGMQMAPVAYTPASRVSNVNLNFGSVNISSGIDLATFEARVTAAVRKALRNG